jgi:putative colanic acid biosynthesis UDP-glucose lipid carrier transferase
LKNNNLTSLSVNQYTFSLLSRLFDFLAIIVSGVISFEVRFLFEGVYSSAEDYFLMISYGAILSLIVFPWFGVYRSWRGETALHQFKAVLLSWTTVWVVVIVLLFSLKASSEFSRVWLFGWYMSTLMIMFIVRRVIYQVLNSMRRHGLNHKKVVVYGAGDLGKDVLSRVQSSDWIGIDVLVLFDDNENLKDTKINGVPVITDSKLLPRYITENNIDEIWLALPLRAEIRLKQIITLLRHNIVTIKLLPDIFGMRLINHSVGDMLGLEIC